MRTKRSKLKDIILGHLTQEKGSLLLAFACMLGLTVAQLLNPWPLKLIFDYVLLERTIPSSFSFFQRILQEEKVLSVVVLSFSMLLIVLVQAMFAYGQIFITSRVGFQLIFTLRKELFHQLQRLSLSFHERTQSGEIITRVASDTKALKNVFSESILTFISQGLMIIGMFVIMFILNWKLTLIVLATFPFLAYSLSILYPKIQKRSRQQRKKEGKVTSRITELLPMISLVQSFAREQHEVELFEADSRQTLEESIRVARIVARTSRTVEILKACGISSAILFGSLQVLDGAMMPGDLLIFASYIKSMYNPVQKISRLSVKFSKAMASAERISDLLDTEPEVSDRPGAIQAENIKGDICFRDVSFGYDDGHEILSKVSLKISSGEKVALVGSSGAGKSTITKLILRLYDVGEGAVLIDGVDIKEYLRESLRRQIGIVLQDSILFGTTIRENISYGKPDATQEEIEAAARLACAHDFIAAFSDGYETVLGERGSTLSGGQRQRIGLARAIIKQPSILILDEPTSAVDAESAKLIHDAMNQFQKGKTSLVIVHQFSSIQHYDQIIVMKEGKVVEQGTHEELLNKKGYYEELYLHQKV